jgi:redox-sensitive bicupin YhaK (pirin superfamily)
MITTRPANERGSAHLGWLDSRHSFSFGHYYDAHHMGFGPLRVINEDWIKPGGGFATHGHSDMEIITYVIDGQLAHKDSTGGGSVIGPGIVQHMSAGSGIRHSEYNPSETAPVHLLQIWIVPDEDGIEPGYAEKHFDLDTGPGGLRLIASKDGRDGSLPIHQDADLYAARIDGGASLTHQTAPGRKLWVQVVAGRLTVNDIAASAGDGLAVSDELEVAFSAGTDAEFLLFDMASA